MNDLKQFWDEEERLATITLKFNKDALHIVKSLREKQGLFFWERGGKQFVENHNGGFKGQKNWKQPLYEDKLKLSIDIVSHNTEDLLSFFYLEARDFLDALACLGEEEIKNKIKELK